MARQDRCGNLVFRRRYDGDTKRWETAKKGEKGFEKFDSSARREDTWVLQGHGARIFILQLSERLHINIWPKGKYFELESNRTARSGFFKRPSSNLKGRCRQSLPQKLATKPTRTSAAPFQGLYVYDRRNRVQFLLPNGSGWVEPGRAMVSGAGRLEAAVSIDDGRHFLCSGYENDCSTFF